jgi:hypothetical protein
LLWSSTAGVGIAIHLAIRIGRRGVARERGGALPANVPLFAASAAVRLHGGLSTGPKTLEGLRRIRAANTKHGRFSAEGLAFDRWRRQYIRNGDKSARAMRDPGARAHFRRRASEEILPRLIEQMRQSTREEVHRRDVERLRTNALSTAFAI